MTVFENALTKNINEFAEWLVKYCVSDSASWWNFWDNNYCKKCESVKAYVPAFDREVECAWCELNNNKCKFFPNMNAMPTEEEICKMWLESECQDYED